jgi:hypothetical protein
MDEAGRVVVCVRVVAAAAARVCAGSDVTAGAAVAMLDNVTASSTTLATLSVMPAEASCKENKKINLETVL